MSVINTQNPPAEYQSRVAPGKDWREIVALVGDLPPMPQVASRAIGMVEDQNTTAVELEKLLSTDTALAARVLKIANSAMFSRQREITTLGQAIMIIGFKALKGIIVAAALRQLNKRSGQMETMIWQNSTATAMFANLIARKLKKRYLDEVFLLGLLHSLGQIVLMAQAPNDFKKVLKVVEDKGIDYVNAEMEIFGFSHPLIGALVAKKWNFSAEACQVILHYRDALDTAKPENDQEEKTALVKLADYLAHKAKIGSPANYTLDPKEAFETAVFIGFDPKTVEQDLTQLVEAGLAQNSKESGIYD